MFVVYVRKYNNLIGVIVVFKKSDFSGTVKNKDSNSDIKIGWSLCKPIDKFDKYDGIRRAIERAEPLPLVSKRVAATKFVLLNKKDYVGPKNGFIPHTCLKYVERIIERAQKHFAPRELDAPLDKK
jgi:hypothetical protein